MVELRPGDVRVYMKRCFDLARTIDPVAWNPNASAEAWGRRVWSVWSARHRIEMEADERRRAPSRS